MLGKRQYRSAVFDKITVTSLTAVFDKITATVLTAVVRAFRAVRRQVQVRPQRRRSGSLQHHPLQAGDGRKLPVGARRGVYGG